MHQQSSKTIFYGNICQYIHILFRKLTAHFVITAMVVLCVDNVTVTRDGMFVDNTIVLLATYFLCLGLVTLVNVMLLTSVQLVVRMFVCVYVLYISDPA